MNPKLPNPAGDSGVFSSLPAFEREFLRLAANMLRCRFQVLHGHGCTEPPPWVQYSPGTPIDSILCYVGYSDHAGEMRLLCREVSRGAL